MNPALRRRIGRMEEVSDRCCRPRRPTSRREGGRESPPTREGSGILGATDPASCGGRKAATHPILNDECYALIQPRHDKPGGRSA